MIQYPILGFVFSTLIFGPFFEIYKLSFGDFKSTGTRWTTIFLPNF
jgi:hypothetical protein